MNNQIGSLTYAPRNNGGRYEYIISQDELIRAFNDSRNALNYPLLKESKRQRFLIANSKGLEQLFFKMVNEDIAKATATIEKNVAKDVYGYLMAAIHGTSYTPSANGLDLGAILGKALGETLTALATAIWEN